MSIAYLPAYFFIGIVLLSVPISTLYVHVLGNAPSADERTFWALATSYAFAGSLCALWVYPLLGWPGLGSMRDRARLATRYWHWILSGFTVVIFQSVHSWGTWLLHSQRGQPFEWPFEAYALSDARWREYNNGTGLPIYVHYININDVSLSVLVLVALISSRLSSGSFTAFSPWAICMALFRDATMFRETVEYLWDHHVNDYPHTISDPRFRIHGIVCLYLINIVWIIGPMLNLWVSYDLIRENTKSSRKVKRS